MDNKQIVEGLQLIMQQVEQKKSKLIFFVADTAGKPMASVEYIYRLAKIFKDEGYNVNILHEKDKFIGVKDWLGKQYAELPHYSLSQLNNNKNFQINGSDYFFIPELYIDLIKNLHDNKLPSETVIICQNLQFIFQYLQPGENWRRYGVEHVITTSEKMKHFLEEYQAVNNIHVINPIIDSIFSPSTFPQNPEISLFCRDQHIANKVVSMFMNKYPMYGWIPFKVLGSMSKTTFAENLKQSCMAVFIDDLSTFGTFPLECMASGVPVIIKFPDLIPEWAEVLVEDKLNIANNAIYVSNILSLPDYIAKLLESWLLDDFPMELYNEMKLTPLKYTEENFKEQSKKTLKNIIQHKQIKLTKTIEKYTNE